MSAGTRKRAVKRPLNDNARGEPKRPVIAIEIDPGLAGGFAHGRFDVTIRGRVAGSVPIGEVRLQSAGRVVGRTVFGQPERAEATALPDGTQGRQLGFHFNLSCAGDGQSERCAFQIVARTVHGLEYAEIFEIDVDPGSSNRISVVSGPAPAAVAFVRSDTVMYIERAVIYAGGILSLHGWAIARDPVQAIEILAGDVVVGNAAIGGERNDVLAAFPAYPGAAQSGFSLTVQLHADLRDTATIMVRMVCPDGLSHAASIPAERLSPRPQARAGDRGDEAVRPAPLPDARDEPSGIRLHCDAAHLTAGGDLSLDGWALCAAGIVQVRVLLDDREVGLAATGHERADVGHSFPDIPMSHFSGFRFEKYIGGSVAGEHRIRIVVRSMHDREEEAGIAVVAEPVLAGEPPPEPGPYALTERQAREFRFELDSPAISNGVAAALVTGRLTIDGWLLTQSGIAKFQIFLDGQRLGDVHYGLGRQDVGAAFPDWPNAVRSGFAFHCPPRSLRDGDHTIEIRIKANNGEDLTRAFGIVVKKNGDRQDAALIRRAVPHVETGMLFGFMAGLGNPPVFRLIVRQDAFALPEKLRTTLDALRLQAYDGWTALILADSDTAAAAAKAAIDTADPWLAGRLTIVSPSDSAAWTAPLGERSSDKTVLYALLLPGDEPGADALLELAVASVRHPGHDMIYTDEVRLSPVSNEIEPFFKPDFSPDLLLSSNYIGRFWTMDSGLLAKTGATPASLIANGEYDLVLRCSELAIGVHHIPKLLCQRVVPDLDDAGRERGALERALDRRGIAGEVLATPIHGTWRVRRPIPSAGKVSIIIPTCAAHGYIETCIDTLRGKTAYRDFEIICIDNIPETGMAWKLWLQENADQIVEISSPFNWSVFNNRAAEVANGEFLLFLNDDMEITDPDWLGAMLEHARRPEVGITGPQLLYRDGKVQHAGMFLSNTGIGRHAFRFAAHDDPCYFGLALTQRNVIAVTGACMLVRRETFEQLGGFDEAHEIVNNDLDFCLRVHRAGLLTVFTPYATLVHYELASRSNMKDVYDLTHFNAAWKTVFAAGDPYFNPRLSRHDDDYRPDDEPVQWVVAGGPMFAPAEIERILVVKLDHIGDFVTALPPIRRLKSLFPHARITVLAGPASRAFVALEPCIDDFIPFAFFHARSQLGERELTADDYAGLAAQLQPYRFDLAVDLRKHISTRDVLKFTGARFLAGFDYQGQFPFLDIALDWDGDRTLQRKRSHIVDDLMALVNAIGHASEPDRAIIQPEPAGMPLTDLPDPVRALFAKPVVAIHPGAGNITKQWPEHHFCALIDLLTERNNVNILLVGGPDEIETANALLRTVRSPRAIASLAGQTSLTDLPRLLKTCVLYIGNDSGPKHIAAAIGMPTIGIHSGVVDPVEWGPVGPNAIALRRNMTCSPCYLANAEDCPRSLACLRLLEPNLVYEAADLMLKPVVPERKPALKAKQRRRQRSVEPA